MLSIRRAFNCVEGQIERLVKEIEMKLKDKRIFVSTSSQMWRGMYSVGGHQFRIAKKAIDADLEDPQQEKEQYGQ